MPLNDDIALQLGNRVRIRVCGLLLEEESLLMVNHGGLYGHDFWSPPGGGLNFGEGVEDALRREFMEECGLAVEPVEFLFGCSVRRQPLHAVELFFRVRQTGGTLTTGHDPERNGNQIISAVGFLTAGRIGSIPAGHKHPVLSRMPDLSELARFRGFLDFT